MKELDARKRAPQVLELVRRHALDLRSQGYPWAEIARICGVHVNTVLKWSRRAKEKKETGGLCGAVYVAVQYILEGEEGTPSKMLEDSALP